MARKHKPLTTAQYSQALQQARARHDSRYEIDSPKPAQKEASQEVGIERAVNYLWVIWLILGLAGALISLPHTLKSVMATVDLEGWLQIGYGIAAFIGVELALIGVALVSALKESERQGLEESKQASLIGLFNGLCQRIGLRAPFKLDHLPDRKPSTGFYLVGLLFLASLAFNLTDALKDVPLLAQYEQEVLLISRLMAGILGPGLLLISGHRFAYEIVRSGSKRQRLELAYHQQLRKWEEGLHQSWKDHSEALIREALASKWQSLNTSLGADDNPYLEQSLSYEEEELQEEQSHFLAGSLRPS